MTRTYIPVKPMPPEGKLIVVDSDAVDSLVGALMRFDPDADDPREFAYRLLGLLAPPEELAPHATQPCHERRLHKEEGRAHSIRRCAKAHLECAADAEG